MRQTILFIITVSLCSILFAQGGPTSVNNTYRYLKDGDLKKAKEEILKAEKNPNLNNWYKTYYFKGRTYLAIGVSEKPEYQKLCYNCLDTAYAAFDKSIKLNFLKEEHKNIDFETEAGLLEFEQLISNSNEKDFYDSEALFDIIVVQFPALVNAFSNKGVDLYKEENFDSSLFCFEKAIKVSRLTFKVDTQLYYFASIAAQKAYEFNKTIYWNNLLLESNYGVDNEVKSSIYLSQANAYKEIGDTTNMLEILERGIEMFPNANEPLIIEMFNYYITADSHEKAYKFIQLIIQNDPDNPEYHVIKGVMEEEKGNPDIAEKDYTYALLLDSTCFTANYSLGALYFNAAVDSLENIPDDPEGSSSRTTYSKVYWECSDSLFRLAAIYLEKAYKQEPYDLNILKTLHTVYFRIGDMEKYEEVKSKIELLENKF